MSSSTGAAPSYGSIEAKNDELSATWTLESVTTGPGQAITLRNNFIQMSFFFSLNVASVTTAISFASTDFADIANYSNGLLYGFFIISCIFLCKPMIAVLGSKRAIFCGLALYCMYIFGYLIGVHVGPNANWVVLLGSALGGIGAGIAWVGQGDYFSASAQLYGRAADIPDEQATGTLGSIFGTIFLLFEVVLKFATSLIRSQASVDGIRVTYLLLALCGLASLVGTLRILPISVRPTTSFGNQQVSRSSVVHEAAAGLALLCRDPKMVLVLPYCVGFSFNCQFMNGFISPSITATVLSEATIGYFAGMAACVAAIVAFGAGLWVQRHSAKWPVMLLGTAGMFLATIPCVINLTASTAFGAEAEDAEFPVRELVLPWYQLVLLYVGQGVGRGVFESMYRAVISDLFASDAAAGFANMQMIYGVSAALAYFLFPSLTAHTKAVVSAVAAPLGFVGYYVASVMHSRRVDLHFSTSRSSNAKGLLENENGNAMIENHDAL